MNGFSFKYNQLINYCFICHGRCVARIAKHWTPIYPILQEIYFSISDIFLWISVILSWFFEVFLEVTVQGLQKKSSHMNEVHEKYSKTISFFNIEIGNIYIFIRIISSSMYNVISHSSHYFILSAMPLSDSLNAA